MDKNIVISLKTILFTVFFGFIAFLLFRLASVVGVIFVAFLLAISLEHTVQFFKRQTVFNKKLSRSTAVVITYVSLLLLIVIVFSVGLDPVIGQSQKLLALISRTD
ncbi:hypothetical protein ACFL13_03135, partial [Patescibacteria group bacterium]